MVFSIFIQLIGLAGMLCILWSFQQNKRSLILVYLIIGQILFSIHFGLLGAWTAAVIDVIAIVRGIIFYYKPHQRWAQNPAWVIFFISCIWFAGIITWEGYRSLFLIIAMTVESIALWNNNPKNIRWCMLASRPLFFSYNILVGSYAGMVADILFTISLIAGMIRFDRTKQR